MKNYTIFIKKEFNLGVTIFKEGLGKWSARWELNPLPKVYKTPMQTGTPLAGIDSNILRSDCGLQSSRS